MTDLTKFIESDCSKETDKCCVDIVDSNPNMMIPWYIMASYAYYVQDDPLISDNVFDRMSKKLLEQWDEVKHFHKDYLNRDMVRAGTYLGDYPSRVKDAVEQVRKTYGKKSTRRNSRSAR